MKRAAVTVIAGLLVAACTSLSPGPDYASINQSADTIKGACKTQFLSGLIKTHLAEEKCIHTQELALYEANHVPDMDIYRALAAKIEFYADQLDKGAISETQEHALISTAEEHAASEAQQRAANRGAMAARDSAAVSEGLGSLGAGLNSLGNAHQSGADAWGRVGNELSHECGPADYNCAETPDGPMPADQW